MLWEKSDHYAPVTLLRPIGAVVHDDMAYFRNIYTSTIYSCKGSTQEWGKLLDCPVKDTSLVVLPVTIEGSIQYLLHVIGGKILVDQRRNDKYEFSGALYNFQADKPTPWQHAIADYPDMSIKRSQVTVVYSNDHIIAAGGFSVNGTEDTVEVFKVQTLLEPQLNNDKKQDDKKWLVVARLPLKVFKASNCVCDGFLYILGGHELIGEFYCATGKAFRTSIEELVKSRPGDTKNVFTEITTLHFKESAFVSFHNQVVQIGGWALDGIKNQPKGTNFVHVYNNKKKLWDKVDECFNRPRCQCFAVAFGEKMIMTVGGYDMPNGLYTDSVEFTK